MTTQRWNIDTSHSGIQFKVRHMVISKVRGTFKTWQGTVDFDPQSPADAKVAVHIDATSIDTHEPKRDEHLRSADFFHTEKFPAITFAGTQVEKISAEKYRLVGDLTLHGVTRSVELETQYLGGGKDPWGNERIAFEAHTSVNRKDFGLGWNQVLEAGGVLVGEQIEITLDIQAVKAKETAAAA